MQFEWSLVPWASGVVKHLAIPADSDTLSDMNDASQTGKTYLTQQGRCRIFERGIQLSLLAKKCGGGGPALDLMLKSLNRGPKAGLVPPASTPLCL